MKIAQDKKISTFQDLNVWQESRRLLFIIYNLTLKFPKEEVFSSVSQMRRAAMSVTSRIAEGFSRSSKLDKLHLCVMARGSLTELQNQVILTTDVSLITQADKKTALEQSEITHKLLTGLIKSTEKRQ